MDVASLTRAEAEERSRLLEVTRYDLDVDLTGLLEGDTLRAVSTVTFTCAEPGASTFVDCVADVERAELNGVALDPADASRGRLPLRDLQAENVLVVASAQSDTASSNGVQRTVDASDGLVYVWTSFEPDEARRVWACFDQPDLKAPHRFVVRAPESWTVTSNTGPESVTPAPEGTRTWAFPDTPRLSTYVVVVNAGPFHEVRQQHDGYDLGFYCRQSLVHALERDLDDLVTITRQGLAFFGERFGAPFPQQRYDQVFVPDLGGAMENWGCVTYGDAQLSRTPPSHAQRALLAEFVLHEMAHMWFGDLVTMRWWDDLWLNEAFASWASNWALSRATEYVDQWAGFLAIAKRAAYELDMGPARHPIRAEVPDVDHATANFDAITYVKGQSVLHQLMAYLGEDAFVAGLRAYFRDHAWGNTRLDDLMSAFGAAAGTDLTGWTAAWLDRAGTDTLRLVDGTIHAESPDDQPPRPHRLSVASYAADGEALLPVASADVLLSEPVTPVDLPVADLHLVNAGDTTFAAVRPDEASLRTMLDRLGQLPEPLSRALVVATVNQLLLLGELAPREGGRAVIRALRTERNPSLVEPFLSVALTISDRWASPTDSPGLMESLADSAVVLAGVAEHRQPALRTLAATATTDEHWEVLDKAVAEADDLDLAWRATTRRSELSGYDDRAVQRLLDQDRDPEAHVKRLRALAAAPDTDAKEQVWDAVFVHHTVPAGRDTLDLGATFWRPTQADLLRPYTRRYLEELPRLTGGLLHQGLVIRAMFPYGTGDETFLEGAQALAADQSLGAYARNTLRAGSFTLSRILAARAL
ncbi:aminopeptidase N [Nocardioides sp. GXQ0305]|uniref:aminopeptidase N n=1 Tax=Nocardioides sp. GXQ0305 TaxID=3423912 RepID=UPI003D7F0E9C